MSNYKSIFISYRRSDSREFTRQLYNCLTTKFGHEKVFRDLDSIPGGEKFKQYIDRELAQCKILIAVIGQQWLQVADKNGKPKLDNPQDWVRLEIEYALQRGIPVIPLLINDTRMPQPQELPETLKGLRGHHCLRMRYGSSLKRRDIDRLLQDIERWLKDKTPSKLISTEQLDSEDTLKLETPSPSKSTQKISIRNQIWRQFWNRSRVASLLLIPAIYLDFSFHNKYVQQSYEKLHETDQTTKQEGLSSLTKDCKLTHGNTTGYLSERFRGLYCRSLPWTDFSSADLSGLDLRFTDLGFVNLSSANLSFTNLSSANLSGANLSNANLSNANLSQSKLRSANLRSANLRATDLSKTDFLLANLSNADLSKALVLAADLGSTKGLTDSQLTRNLSPLICNSVLPRNIEIEGSNKRDCEEIASLLHNLYYPGRFKDFEAAMEFVNTQRTEDSDSAFNRFLFSPEPDGEFIIQAPTQQ